MDQDCARVRDERAVKDAMTETPVESVIEISVQEAAQLFETLDPYPFRDRDLDREAEAYIVDWARELPGESALRIVIHMPKAQTLSHPASETAGAMARFFLHRRDAVSSELRELFRRGERAVCLRRGRAVRGSGDHQYAARTHRAGEPGDHGVGRQLAAARDLPL
jgi:hypothetical protein